MPEKALWVFEEWNKLYFLRIVKGLLFVQYLNGNKAIYFLGI